MLNLICNFINDLWECKTEKVEQSMRNGQSERARGQTIVEL